MIARRYQHAINTQLGDGLAERSRSPSFCFLKNGRIGRDMIAETFSFLDHRDGFVENAVTVANEVMSVTHPVEVDVE